MKDPKQVCREHNIYSYQAYKGAELMAGEIRENMQRILTTPSSSTVYEQLKEYFNLNEK